VDPHTSAHAGYSRYFTPPTLQYISTGRIDPFRNTTNAPETYASAPPRSERAHYFDVGVSREFSPHWRITFDAFYKISRQTQDLGQFGNAIILAPFNYREGSAPGLRAERNLSLRRLSAYANFSFVYTQARDIDTAQFEFPVNELDYIQNHFIRLDHEGGIYGFQRHRLHMG